MELHKIQAAVAEAAVRKLLEIDCRSPSYNGEFITDPYKIRAAVAEAIQEVLSEV